MRPDHDTPAYTGPTRRLDAPDDAEARGWECWRTTFWRVLIIGAGLMWSLSSLADLERAGIISHAVAEGAATLISILALLILNGLVRALAETEDE